MNSVLRSLLVLIRLSCSKITHELPRVPPYSPYSGYVSPLRPGYRWGEQRSLPHPGYIHHPHLPQHPQHPQHLHHPQHPQQPHHPQHSQHAHIPQYPHFRHLPHHFLPRIPPLPSSVQPVVVQVHSNISGPARTEQIPSSGEVKTPFSIEEEEALEETPRAARENTEQEEIYKFGYAVKDDSHGDDFSHQVSHDEGRTDGEYRVVLPDGRVQVVKYSADESGYNADVSYLETNNTGSNGRQFSSPVVLVKSPQPASDPLLSSLETEYNEEINNPKRNINNNINIHSTPTVLPYVVRHRYGPSPANMHVVDHSYYIIPKKTGGHLRPRYPGEHYRTNFGQIERTPHRPVRFPPTLKTTYKSKISFVSSTQQSNISTTTETTTPSTTLQTASSLPRTVSPLLPAFHPDYKPASYHQPRHQPQGKRHKKHVPWASYSGSITGNSILPAFHPDYTPDNYVTPVSQSSHQDSKIKIENSTSSISLILSTAELLASLTKFRTKIPTKVEDKVREVITTAESAVVDVEVEEDVTTAESVVVDVEEEVTTEGSVLDNVEQEVTTIESVVDVVDEDDTTAKNVVVDVEDGITIEGSAVGDIEEEISTEKTMIKDVEEVSTAQNVIESDGFLNSEDSEDIKIDDVMIEIETTTEIETGDEETTSL